MKIFNIQTIGWNMLCFADSREQIRLKLVALGHNWWQIDEAKVAAVEDLPKCKDSEI